MKLNHPNSDHVVETENPEPYLSQGWVEVEAAPVKKSTTDETKAK